MKSESKGNIYVSWVLRILLIITIIFWSMFSFDVFDEGLSFWDTALALFMHNIPSLVMIIILIIAWKWENLGGTLLMLGIVGFVAFLVIQSRNFMFGTLIVVGIPFVIGAMFVFNYYFLGKKLLAETNQQEPDTLT